MKTQTPKHINKLVSHLSKTKGVLGDKGLSTNMQKEKQTVRGRPVGTYSYAVIGAADAAKIVKNHGFVPVSKRWLKSVGVDISTFADFSPQTHQHNPIVLEHKPEETKTEKPKAVKVKSSPQKEPVKAKTVKGKITNVKKVKDEEPIQVTLEA